MGPADREADISYGILFMIFVAWVLIEAFRTKWTWEKRAGALAASVILFAPCVVDLSPEPVVGEAAVGDGV